MVLTIIADYMQTDSDRTKLVFLIGETKETTRNVGYLGMTNEYANAFLKDVMMLSVDAPISEFEQDGHLIQLVDKRGRRDHG